MLLGGFSVPQGLRVEMKIWESVDFEGVGCLLTS
jgi:hypothetical protein